MTSVNPRAYYRAIDNVDPVAYSTSNSSYWEVVGNGTSGSPSTSARATVTFKDEKLFTANQLKIKVYDSDQSTVIPFANGATEMPLVNIESTDNLWQGTFDIMTEATVPKTIYVQAIDATGNISAMVPIQLQYIDAKGPTITVTSNPTDWKRNKVITLSSSDIFGTAKVGISADDLVDISVAPYNGSRSFTITGDVYDTKPITFYAMDSLGNLSYLSVPVQNVDNTPPTITDVVSVLGTRTSTITVSANDINSQLGTVGSGVEYYSISREKNPLMTESQDSNTFTVNDKGIYYVKVGDNAGNWSQPYAVGVYGLDYITASLNSLFTSTYASLFNGTAYNVDEDITVTNDMVDAVIHYTDGSTAATTDFTLSDATIVGLDDNYVKVSLNSSSLSCNVRVNGYSASLSSAMADLGVADGDYIALATKLLSLKTQVSNLTADIAKYNTALTSIVESLATQDIDVEMVADLTTKLGNIVAGVQTAVSTIASYKEQISQIQNKVNVLVTLYAETGSGSLELNSILDQLDSISADIVAANSALNTANGLRTNLRNALSLEAIASDSDILAKVNDLNSRIISLESQMSSYAGDLADIKEELATHQITVELTDNIMTNMTNTLNGVKESVLKLTQLKAEITGLRTNLNTLASLLGVPAVVSDAYDDILSQIGSMQAKVTSLNSMLAEYESFRDDLIDALELQEDSTLAAIHGKVLVIKNRMESAEQCVTETNADIDLLAAYFGISTAEASTPSEKLALIEAELEDLDTDLRDTKDDLADYIVAHLDGAVTGGSDLAGYVENIQVNIGTLESKTTELLTYMDSLRGILDLEPDASLGDVVASVQDMKDDLYAAKQDILQYEATINVIRTELSILDTTGGSSTLGDKLSNLTDGAEALAEKIQAMEQMLSEKLAIGEVTLDDADRIGTEITNIKNSLSTANTNITLLQGQLDASRAENVTLQEQNDALTAQLATAMEQIATLQGEKANLQTELDTVIETNEAQAAIMSANLTAKDNKILELTGDLADANTNIVSLEATIVTKNEEILTLTNRVQALEADVEELEADVASKATTITNLTNQNMNLSSAKADLEAEVSEKSAAIVALTSEVQSLRNTKATLEGQVATRDTQIASLEADKTSLEADVAAKSSQIASLTANKALLEGDIADKSNQIATLSSEKTSLESQVAALQAAKISLEDDVEDKSGQIAALESTKSSLESEIATKNSQITSLTGDKEELEATVVARDSRIATLEADKSSLEDEVAAKSGQIEALTAAKATLEGDIAAKSNQITALEDDIVAKSNQITSLEAGKSELEDEIILLEAEVDELSELVLTKTTQITTLEGEKSNLETEVAGLTDSLAGKDAEITSLSSQVTALVAEKVELEAQVDSLIEAGSATVALPIKEALGLTAEANMEAVEAFIQRIKTELARAKESIALQDTEIARVKKELQDANTSLADKVALQLKFDKLTADSQELAKKLSAINTILKDKLSLGDIDTVEASTIGKQIDSIKANLASSSQEVNRLTTALAQANADKSLLQSEKVTLDGDLARLKNQIAELTSANSNLKVQLEAAQLERQSLSSKNATLEQELADTQMERDVLALNADKPNEYEVKYVEITKTVEVIKTEVVELQKEVEVKEQEISTLVADKENLESALETLEMYKEMYDSGTLPEDFIPSKPDIGKIEDNMPDLVEDESEVTAEPTEVVTPVVEATVEPTPEVTEAPTSVATLTPTPTVTPEDKLDEIDFGGIEVYMGEGKAVESSLGEELPAVTLVVTPVISVAPEMSAIPSDSLVEETTKADEDNTPLVWLIVIAGFAVVGVATLVVVKIRKK